MNSNYLSRKLLFYCLCFFFTQISLAQDSNEQVNKSVISIVRTDKPPKIDGIITPDEWENAAKTELTNQFEPQQNSTATEKTIAYLQYDKEYLYIAFHAFDSEPSAIRAPVSKRDSIALDDFVSVWLDTFDDRRRTYVLRFNPLGIQEDGIFTDSESDNLTWDGIFESKGTLTGDGYIVEAAIPFKTLRFQINSDKKWGLHLFRKIARKNERDSWMPISPDKQNLLIQMGNLSGLEDIFAGRTLDVIPTVTFSNTGNREEDPNVPFGAKLNTVNKLDLGVTATYTLTPNLTLSATVNPDFSQIENDVPQVSVNQRFPLFFPERRPFFLEGGEIFRGAFESAPRIVDTRQIVEPDWGIKLTGKIGKNTIGLLSVSDNAPGLRIDPADENFGKNAQFNIFRYSRDILKQSSIGFIFTNRRFADTSNTTATVDGRLQLNDKNLIAYQFSYSRTTDGENVKSNGGSSYVVYNYDDRNWDFGISNTFITKDFRADTGFIRRTDINRTFIDGGRTFRPEEKSWWVKARPFVVSTILKDGNGKIDESFFDPGIDLEFARGISIYTYYSTRRDNFLGRGYTSRTYILSWTVEAFRTVSTSGYFETGTGVNFDESRPELGKSFNSEVNLTFKPITPLSSEFLWLRSNLKSRAGGDSLFAQDIIRNRTIYQFNRFNAVRSIIDYDTLERRIGVSLLYAYTPHPNTALFVGYGDELYNGFDPFYGVRRPGITRQSRSLFAKISYNFRF